MVCGKDMVGYNDYRQGGEIEKGNIKFIIDKEELKWS